MFIFFVCLYTPLRGAKKTNQKKDTLSLVRLSADSRSLCPLEGYASKAAGIKKTRPLAAASDSF